MSKYAVFLSGSGVYDGAEIHESVITLLTISRNGDQYQCFAPDRDQMHVVDHKSGKPVSESRNILAESARIARGEILPLDQYDPEEYDAIFFPGGFGVAKNFFSFAVDGINCKIDQEIADVILNTHQAGIPIGAMCIAPVLLAKAFQNSGHRITVTVGRDTEEIAAIREFGAEHEDHEPDEVCVDQPNKIATVSAYICSKDIAQVANGIEKLVAAVKQLEKV